MKKILILIIFPFFAQTQTTHYFNWGYNTVNQQIEIEAGDTVEWLWVGSGSHNLISTGGVESFNSGYGSSGKTFTYTFNNIGSTSYICTPHAGNMFGTVTVTSQTASIDEESINKFRLYPNPTNSIVIIEGNKNYFLEVYDILGNKIMSSFGNSINMTHLSNSTYIINALDEETNERFLYKVIKK